METHLLNILPSVSISNDTPHYRLFHRHPTYDHLRVFGCLCFPRLHATHKLQPRSTPCIFLGYPTYHRGFRCFDLSTRKIIIYRHVIFDESVFTFGSVTPTEPPSYDFLADLWHFSYSSTYTSSTASHFRWGGWYAATSISSFLSSRRSTTVATPLSSSYEVPPHAGSPPSHPLTGSPPHEDSPSLPPIHHMHTRSKSGIVKPILRLNLHSSSISSVPRSLIQALKDPNWHEAMNEGYNALITNGTWVLVPRPLGANVVRSMWLFKHKFNADISLPIQGSFGGKWAQPATWDWLRWDI